MRSKGEEIKRLLSHIFNKLKELENKIEKQEEDIRIFLTTRDSNYEPSHLLIAQQKATRTSVELLREEIEEVHHVIKLVLSN
jgi:predicted ribosome quality control (RQC) complex YloA/Tae2 family protein